MDSLYNFTFIALHFAFILTIFMIVMIFRRKEKTQLHYAFIVMLGSILIWQLGQLLEVF